MYIYMHTFRDTHTNQTHAHTHTYQTTYTHMYTFTLTPHCQEEAEDKVGIATGIENWGSVVT